MTVKFSELHPDEVFFRMLGRCLYKKKGDCGVLLHPDDRKDAGDSFVVGSATSVHRPKLSVKDGWIVATHPDKSHISFRLTKVVDGVPDSPLCYFSHLTPGTVAYGFGPYGTTALYRIDPTVKGSYNVNVTHMATGKQLLASSL